MGNGMNKVMPGLFIGNFRDAKDDQQLSANNITHIVAIHDNPKPAIEEITYKCVDLPDSPAANIGAHLTDCTTFIHEARINGGNVLVHCVAGVSRSCTVCAAYLITISQIPWSDAILVVRAARDVVNPNYGFQTQLHTYDIMESHKVRAQLIEKYGEINGNDITFIKEVMTQIENNPQMDKTVSTAFGSEATFGSCERQPPDGEE